MSDMEFVFMMFSTVGGLFLMGFFFHGIFSLLKAWINRKSGNTDIDPQFFKALGEFKRTTERRLSNLEAIITEMDEVKIRAGQEKEAGEITIESEDGRGKSGDKDSDRNLRNMLHE